MLKKEVRILGLSVTSRKRHRTIVVGVVFRGSLWLDGMIICSLEPSRRDHTLRISRAIVESRQYSQLHAIILSRTRIAPGRDIDISELGSRVRLPVIAVVERRRVRKRRIEKSANSDRYHLMVKGNRVSVLASRIGLKDAQDVFSVACARDFLIPEAARVADLITEQVTLKWNSLRLG